MKETLRQVLLMGVAIVCIAVLVVCGYAMGQIDAELACVNKAFKTELHHRIEMEKIISKTWEDMSSGTKG